MSGTNRNRQSLAEDFQAASARLERLGDLFAGLALLFGAVTALVVTVGAWTEQPLFSISSGFALAATIAFAGSARVVGQAGRELRARQPIPFPAETKSRPVRRREAA
jgi:hypothetical protein